ncbi:zinc-binding dehydrogenase [Pseudomonas ogarae]
MLGEGGRLVSTLTKPDASHPQAAGKTGARFTAAPRGEELTEIAGLIEAGNVQVYIAKVFELEAAVQALDYLANEHVYGKVVLHISDRGGVMSEPSKPHTSGHAGQKVRSDTAKRNDKSEAPAVNRPREADVDQGGVAPEGPSKDPETGA